MKYEGIWTALATPFEPTTGDLDRAAFDRLLQRQIEGGVHGVVPCAVTGESPTFSDEEWSWIARRTLETCRGTSTSVMVGVNSNNTRRVIELIEEARKAGATSVLAVAPYFNKPNPASLLHHFGLIASAAPQTDVMLYHAPGRCGVGFTPATVIELARRHKNIVGLKDGHGDPDLQRAILDGVDRKSFVVMSGDDPSSFTSWMLGGSGSVSVASNIDPAGMVRLWKSRDPSVFENYFPLFADLFLEPNPIPLKEMLAMMGLCSAHVRPPLISLTALGDDPRSRATLGQLNKSLSRVVKSPMRNTP